MRNRPNSMYEASGDYSPGNSVFFSEVSNEKDPFLEVSILDPLNNDQKDEIDS